MAEICCGVVTNSEGEASSTSCAPSSVAAAARRSRKMEIRRFKFDVAADDQQPAAEENGSILKKRQKLLAEISPATLSSTLQVVKSQSHRDDNGKRCSSAPLVHEPSVDNLDYCGADGCPKFGTTAICGRRRDMEDAVAIHPSFCQGMHFFGVYDGHGCSHVAMACKDRLHQLVKEELENHHHHNHEAAAATATSLTPEWKGTMERSYSRMDKEVLIRPPPPPPTGCNGADDDQQSKSSSTSTSNSCRCELQMPQCDAVGSTAVVSIVTPDKIVVANCGDSRAILCRAGKPPVPLSIDHKPDLPEELDRIQGAGGRVIYWDGPRVLGVLAMSRAVGDNYLKPYVISVPDVTITERTEEDECLILATDGLWDVVSNDTACGIARMCFKGSQGPPSSSAASAATTTETSRKHDDGGKVFEGERTDKACSDAAMLLTKLALARRSADNVSVVVIDLRKKTN